MKLGIPMFRYLVTSFKCRPNGVSSSGCANLFLKSAILKSRKWRGVRNNKFVRTHSCTTQHRHTREVVQTLCIAIPSFTGTYNTTLPEEERWMIQVQVPGRTFTPVTEPIEFTFDAPTWSLGKSMAAHITMGRIGEVYHNDLKDTIYQICGRRDEQWEMINTRKDRSIAAFI